MPSECALIALGGLFSAALHQQGMLRVSDVYSDPRGLPGERNWTWRGGQVLVCVVGGNLMEAGARGVMALCRDRQTSDTSDTSDTSVSTQAESEILICAALLGAYLEDGDSHSHEEIQ